ncbi:MAG: 30S ribosomal protein S6e [Candidatus Micrarchaeia archaeon]
MKLNISEKSGKTYKVEIDASKASLLFGKKVGDDIEGDIIGVPGYVFTIRGGSDSSGFPMRFDVQGMVKRKILIGSGPGIRKVRKGEKRRKTVRGNIVSEDISQLNLVVKQAGPQALSEILGAPSSENRDKK